MLVDLGGTVASFSWAPAEGADRYGVTRTTLAALGTNDYGTCLTTSLTVQSFDDADPLAPGEGYAYLFLGVDDLCGAGSLGYNSTIERFNLNAGACP